MPNPKAAAAAFDHAGDTPDGGAGAQGQAHMSQRAQAVQAAIAQGVPVDPHDGNFPLPTQAQGDHGSGPGDDFSELMVLMASATSPEGHPDGFAPMPPPASDHVNWGALLGLDLGGHAAPPPPGWGSFDPSAGHHGPA
jgi:hypothetical protein